MSHTRLWVAATIIAVFILTGFVFSVPRVQDLPIPISTDEAVVEVPSVTLHDSFKKGVHTITASILAPNACATVTASTTLQNESILIALKVATDTSVCLQMPTLMKISSTITAPADMPIVASVNGVMASTTES